MCVSEQSRKESLANNHLPGEHENPSVPPVIVSASSIYYTLAKCPVTYSQD